MPKTEGERRHVTVMFTDLTGYTSMCEQLDPEDVKEIMSRIFGEISQVVTKYGGFVEKFIGDAAMALFGVSGAHEDDPVRSILARRARLKDETLARRRAVNTQPRKPEGEIVP